MTCSEQFASFFKIVLSYYTLQLGRGAAVSFLLMGLVLLFRGVCRNTVFLKGLLWSILLLCPFVGRLKCFYEWPLIPSGLWTYLCMAFPWTCGLLYLAGCLATLTYIYSKRRRVCRFVTGMRKDWLQGTEIYVCDSPVTPFTAGTFSPKLVLPAFMLAQYKNEDLEIIVLHEKTHIRLGHLLYYLIWDVLHILFWINPLFTVCIKYFKEDMEDICDRVTIKKCNCTAHAYGTLLLKSIRGLQGKTDMAASNVTFAGDRQFQALKRRIEQVAQYRVYRRMPIYGMIAFTTLIFLTVLTIVIQHSYARYEANESIELYSSAGRLLVADSNELRSAISFDNQQLYICGDKLKAILEHKGINDAEYAVSFGGYFKLPGFGGGFCCEFIDMETLNGPLVQVPYQKPESLYLQIFLML